jgi:hypothetical protein
MGLVWSLERRHVPTCELAWDGAARIDQCDGSHRDALVLADRYSGVSPLGVLYLSHRVVALMFFHGFSAIRADFS